MSSLTTYRPLCKVCQWHAYYLHPVDMAVGDLISPSGRPNALKTAKQEEITSNTSLSAQNLLSNDLLICPSGQTQRLMERGKMVLREESSGFSIWLRAQKNGANFQPFAPLGTPFKLTFGITVRNTAFFNFTLHEVKGGVYYFSNRTNNRFLSTNYLNANPPQTSPPQNYASAADRFALRSGGLVLDISTVLQTDFLRFVLTNDLHSTEFVFEKGADEAFLTKCHIAPQGTPSGLYELKAFGKSGLEIAALKQTFFWNGGDLPPDIFGIIEIFHLPGGALGSYSLLDAEQRLLSPIYTLWWQNRSTFWRYLFEKNQPAPDGNNAACHVRSEAPNRFVTKERMPLLSRFRAVRLVTTPAGNNEEILLPNPSPERIYPEGADDYSEIQMNRTDFKVIQGIN